MDLAILLILILLNGVLAMPEIALVTARKARLQARAAEGDGAAQAAKRLGEDPTRFLSTIQIGITSIAVLKGIFGEAALAGPLAAGLREAGAPDPYAGYAATALVVLLITYLSIVVGELVPKRLGQTHPESLARLVARPINALAIATMPFVRLLTASTAGLLRVIGVSDKASQEAVVSMRYSRSQDHRQGDRKSVHCFRRGAGLRARGAATATHERRQRTSAMRSDDGMLQVSRGRVAARG